VAKVLTADAQSNPRPAGDRVGSAPESRRGPPRRGPAGRSRQTLACRQKQASWRSFAMRAPELAVAEARPTHWASCLLSTPELALGAARRLMRVGAPVVPRACAFAS
jgi:hypothetical protein